MFFLLPWPVLVWLDIVGRVHSHKIPKKTGNILFYVSGQWRQLKLAETRLMLISLELFLFIANEPAERRSEAGEEAAL